MSQFSYFQDSLSLTQIHSEEKQKQQQKQKLKTCEDTGRRWSPTSQAEGLRRNKFC